MQIPCLTLHEIFAKLQPDGATSGEADSTSELTKTEHAAWEMYEIDSAEHVLRESEKPSLDQGMTDKFVEAINLSVGTDEYSLFLEAPEPDDNFATARGGKSSLVNHMACQVANSVADNGCMPFVGCKHTRKCLP